MNDHASILADIAAGLPDRLHDLRPIYTLAAMLALALETQSPTLNSAVTAFRAASSWDDKIARLTDLKHLLIVEYGVEVIDQAVAMAEAQHLAGAQDMLWSRYGLARPVEY